MLPVRQIAIGHFMVADGVFLLTDAAQRQGYVSGAKAADLERYELTLRMMADQLAKARASLVENAKQFDKPKTLIAAE